MSPRLLLTLAAALTLGGCSSATAPMTCEGNPKCKPDTQPSVPSTLQFTQASGGVRTQPEQGKRKIPVRVVE